MTDFKPNPLISRGVPAYSSAGQTPASVANNGIYSSFWMENTPVSITYDLSSIPEKLRNNVVAVWYTACTYDRIGAYVSQNMLPTDYTVEVNSAIGGCLPINSWEIVETVKNNTFGSRQHIVDMTGFNWFRLNFSKADGKIGNPVSLNLDIHSAADGICDNWLFLGDSITTFYSENSEINFLEINNNIFTIVTDNKIRIYEK